MSTTDITPDSTTARPGALGPAAQDRDGADRKRTRRPAADRALLLAEERPLPPDPEPLARAPAGDGRRRARDRADARDPDRGHRPLGRHRDGIRPDRDDEARGGERRAAAARDRARDPRVRRLRAAERRARHRRSAAGVHRHAGYVQHRLRADPRLLGRPDLHRVTEPAALLRAHVHASPARSSPTARC